MNLMNTIRIWTIVLRFAVNITILLVYI